MLGILGGMGPLATVDFMQKVIARTKAGNDQEHIPMVVRNVPQIPDRSAHILNGAENPSSALLEGLKALEDSGATCITMPCNTAHFWLEDLQGQAQVPMISILECVAEEVQRKGLRKIGLMATNATVAANMYKDIIEADGGDCIMPGDEHQQALMDGIYEIKAGNIESGTLKMEKVFKTLIHAGAESVILGCTEIPIGLKRIISQEPDSCLSATDLLAQACVDWHYSQQAPSA